MQGLKFWSHDCSFFILYDYGEVQCLDKTVPCGRLVLFVN